MPKARGSDPDRHLALHIPEERSGGVNITTAMKAATVQLYMIFIDKSRAFDGPRSRV